MSIKDRVAVITGATGGLGSVVSQAFAEKGARLVLVGSSMDRLNSLSEKLNLPPDRILLQAADLTQVESAQTIAAATAQKFSRVDILLHLIGGWAGGKTIVDSALSDLDSMLAQHAWSTFHAARAFVPHLTANHWGRIIVISSPFASRPVAKGGHYAVGKAAQEALVMTLAKELKGSGVTANAILVKSIDTRHQRDTEASPGDKSWTTPEEITATILHLCSDEAGTINGARIPLYGSY